MPSPLSFRRQKRNVTQEFCPSSNLYTGVYLRPD